MTVDSLPRVLLTGVTGQVGSYLADGLGGTAQVYAPSRSELDLASPDSVRAAVERFKPEWILHPAAYTAVDRAESEPELCFAVNAGATGVLAEEARRSDATLITFSTDYVFDGTSDRPYREEDPTSPVNVYGASKLAAEQALASSGCRYINLRTSWVYSAQGSNFVKTILRLAAERPSLNIVADQQGCPTSAAELAHAVCGLLRLPLGTIEEGRGTYHLAGTGQTTWHGFATHLVDEARRIQPDQAWAELCAVPSTAFPTPARRPANSRLDCTRFKQVFGMELPRWTDSVTEVVTQLLR